MEPREKAAQLPESPGVYLFKDAGEKVLYVGKARNLRSRVRSYFLESRWIDAKTGSLAREIADLETIVVGNEREALALEHNLIKQYRPKFNVVLRDDKTYPYIKFTAAEKYPLVPSCTVDLTRSHPRPCLQYYIKRCLGPCVAGLTTDERYAEAARDVRLFLEGRRHDLIKSLEERMAAAAEKELFEQAAAYRDLLRTLEDIEERQRIAAAQGDDTDVLAYYAEPPLVAANLFHLRGGRVVDRREFYWEELEEFDPQEFVTALLKQLYLEAEYLPKAIHVAADFEDRELLEAALTERAGHKVEIFTPQRGTKRAFLDLVESNAKHSFEQRFRVLKPTSKAIGEALQNALNLAEEPLRIESFDISHIQGTDTVASMVVWEKGRMKKSDYRKFIIRGDEERSEEGANGNLQRQNDDFASMREAVGRAANHQSAGREHREKRGDSLRFGTGRRADRVGAPFASAAPDSADSRRDAPFCGHVSPAAARETADANGARRNPRRGGKDGAEAIEAIWERRQYSKGGGGKIERRYLAKERRENS